MHLLEPDLEHRTVRFLEDRSPNLNPVVRSYGHEEVVESGVMELAERQTVADDRIAFVVCISHDVSRVQEFLMTQPTDRALLSIGIQDLNAEPLLMESPPHGRGDVLTPDLIAVLSSPMHASLGQIRDSRCLSHIDLEVQAGLVIPNDVDRPCREILTWKSAIEVDKREPSLHRQSKSSIVRMLGVHSSIRVGHEVWPGLAVRVRRVWTCRDGQWYLADPRLEYALRTHERHPFGAKHETFGKH